MRRVILMQIDYSYHIFTSLKKVYLAYPWIEYYKSSIESGFRYGSGQWSKDYGSHLRLNGVNRLKLSRLVVNEGCPE